MLFAHWVSKEEVMDTTHKTDIQLCFQVHLLHHRTNMLLERMLCCLWGRYLNQTKGLVIVSSIVAPICTSMSSQVICAVQQ